MAEMAVRVGDRVVIDHWVTTNSSIDDNLTVPPGTEGTVIFIDGSGTLHVEWDNGCILGLLPGYEDEYRVLR